MQVWLENRLRGLQKKQLKQVPGLRVVNRTGFGILVMPLLPTASLFNASNRMSLHLSTARNFANQTVSLLSSSPMMALCWLLVDMTKSCACGPSTAKQKSKIRGMPASQLKWRKSIWIASRAWPLSKTTVASSVVDWTAKFSFTTFKRELILLGCYTNA